MRYSILSLVLLMNLSAAEAQTCAPSTKEMAQYFRQKEWRHHSLNGPPGVQPIQGYLDEKGAFYFEDLSRGGESPAVLVADSQNKSYDGFFKYCRGARTQYLRSMRRSGEGNRYSLTMRYLPSLSGMANNPMADLQYKPNSSVLKMKFESDAMFGSLDYNADRLRVETLEVLNRQLAKQNEIGIVQLDLTGLDDLACDLAQGKAKIWISHSAISLAPLVTQKKEVEASEIPRTYQALQDQLRVGNSKEKNIYLAARAIAKLENDRQIGAWAEKKGFEILRQLMVSDMSRLNNLDESALYCVAEQNQTYSRSHIQHFVNVQFQVPSIDEVEGASKEKR